MKIGPKHRTIRLAVFTVWIVVFLLSTTLTLLPCLEIYPLARLPWNGPWVILTWSVAGLDMPATYLLMLLVLIVGPDHVPFWFLPLATGLISLPPLIVSGVKRLWNRGVLPQRVVCYSSAYFVAWLAGTIHTARNWLNFID